PSPTPPLTAAPLAIRSRQEMGRSARPRRPIGADAGAHPPTFHAARAHALVLARSRIQLFKRLWIQYDRRSAPALRAKLPRRAQALFRRASAPSRATAWCLSARET